MKDAPSPSTPVHESEAQRQHVRVRIPAIAEFEVGGQHFRGKVLDISAGGACLEVSDRPLAAGESLLGRITFVVDSIAIGVPVSLLVRNVDASLGRVGCQFRDLKPREISALRHLITSHLAGDMVSVGEMLHTMGRDNSMRPRPAADAGKSRMSAGGKVRAVAATAVIFVCGLAAFLYVAQRLGKSLFMANATSAKVSGPLYTVAMPREGTFHSLVPDDGVVKKGAAIGTFESPVIDLVRAQVAPANLTPEQLDRALAQTVKGTITSPCDCRVQTQFVADLQYAVRAQPLFELSPLDLKPYLIARFDYNQLDELRVGQNVSYRINGDTGDRRGRISQVRVGGLGDQIDSEVTVRIEPETPIEPELIARPVEVATGRWSGVSVDAAPAAVAAAR